MNISQFITKVLKSESDCPDGVGVDSMTFEVLLDEMANVNSNGRNKITFTLVSRLEPVDYKKWWQFWK